MPNCKICGKPVKCVNVFHPGCWENETNRMAETFCDEYCRFPRECAGNEDALQEHCDDCALVRLLNLGL